MINRLAIVLLLVSAPLGAQTQAPYVPPVAEGVGRFVPPSPAPGFIADVPGVVPAGRLAALNARIRALQDSGYGDIGVAIIPSVGDYEPAQVGVAIYRSWLIGRIDSIGSARRNLGVLLLIVPKELSPDNTGHCWITTGTGAEGIVTDAASGRICREEIVPHLQDRDYAAALSAGVDALAGRLRADAGLASEPVGTAGTREDGGGFRWWFIPAGLVALISAVAGGLTWRRRRPRVCPSCGRTMRRLEEQADDAALAAGQQAEERVKSVDYDVWQCSCGEKLVLPYKAVMSSYHECTSCHRRTCKTTRRFMVHATTATAGLAEDTHHCASCAATWVEEIVLPMVTASSGSGGRGGGGGGGGGSFGGSGSTSGEAGEAVIEENRKGRAGKQSKRCFVRCSTAFRPLFVRRPTKKGAPCQPTSPPSSPSCAGSSCRSRRGWWSRPMSRTTTASTRITSSGTGGKFSSGRCRSRRTT